MLGRHSHSAAIIVGTTLCRTGVARDVVFGKATAVDGSTAISLPAVTAAAVGLPAVVGCCERVSNLPQSDCSR